MRPDNPKLRVMLLVYSFGLGGAELLALQIFERLKDDVELSTIAIVDGPLAERFQALGPILILNNMRPPSGKSDIGRADDEPRVKRLSIPGVSRRPDVVYVNSIAAMPILDAIDVPPAPMLLHLHNIETSLALGIEDFRSHFLRLPERYLVVSEGSRQELITRYAIPESKIALVHAFIPDDLPKPSPSVETKSSTRPFIVGGSGNLTWLKGQDLWLQTAVELKEILGEVPFRFAWVGVVDNHAGRIFRYQAEKLKVDSLIDFIPQTPDPLPHYSRFDVFALTSWEDTFPLVVLENMFLEKPVLCFEGGGGGAEEVGGAGIVVPRFSPRDMARAIADLYRDPARRQALGHAARERVLTHFMASTQVPKIWKELEQFQKNALLHEGIVDSEKTTAIVLGVYNGERYLTAAIQSILDQSKRNWQLIIVDDGSTDKSAGIARAFADQDPRIKVVSQENMGLSAARNRGIREADPSDYIAFQDADDIWEPDWLEILLPELEAHPTALGVHGLARFIGSRGQLVGPGDLEAFERGRKAIVGQRLVDWPLDAPTTYAVQAHRNYMPVCGTLVRRAELEATGLFVPGLRSCEDWELWLRMTQRGDFHFVNTVVYNYRLHDANKTNDESFETELRREVRRKIIQSPDISPENRRIAIQGYRFEEAEHYRARIKTAGEFWRFKQPVPALKHWRHSALSYLRSRLGVPR